ncbi:MAG TPA: hypothetical protein VMM35_13370 [Longimicrobiales bacterium]|nr:hypothetical protein [Longimicrobiales bacterium]
MTARLIAASLAALLAFEGASAQDATGRFYSLKGQIISPAYEGWFPNDDGTFTLYFGYFNSNWEEEFDIPVGPENYFTMVEPGELDDLSEDAFDARQADQGQPTHFYPRRNPFLFTLTVPADFGEKEWVWTLKTQERTVRAFGVLTPDYRIDPQVMSTEVGGNFGDLDNRLRENVAPEIRVEGELQRSVRVGEALTITTYADDPDDYPPHTTRDRTPTNLEQLYNPNSAGSVVVAGAPGLRVSWFVYRGPADNVTFAPTQLKAWMDSRVYANSPWSFPYVLPEIPPDNRWRTQVTFSEPGEYVLRGIASDGSQWSYENVRVTVAPLAR